MKNTAIPIPEGTVLIRSREYEGREDLLQLVIPDTVREIGPSAFADCINLEYVRLPAGLTRIRKSLFLAVHHSRG